MNMLLSLRVQHGDYYYFLLSHRIEVQTQSSMTTGGSLGDRYGGAEHILLVPNSGAAMEELTKPRPYSCRNLKNQARVVLIQVLHVRSTTLLPVDKLSRTHRYEDELSHMLL